MSMKKTLRSTILYGVCVPVPFVVLDGVYIPCEVRIALWLALIGVVVYSFFRVKNSG